MKKNGLLLFVFLLLFTNTQAQQCTNFDFEAGQFWGWNGTKGDNTGGMLSPFTNVVPGFFSNGIDAPVNDQLARHTIITGAYGNDTCGGFPGVFPGGSYSVRLGNTFASYQAQTIEQTFVVTDSTVMAHYALVLNISGHTADDSPFFKIEAFDISGNLIPGSVTVITESDSALLFPCALNTIYLPWTTDTINLGAYIGTPVKLRFTVASCSLAAHYAYAYIDATCASSTIGIAEYSTNGFQLLPNPTDGNVTLKLPDRMRQQQLQLMVYDCLGKELLRKTITGTNSADLEIATDLWAPGFYTICMEGENIRLREKLVKH